MIVAYLEYTLQATALQIPHMILYLFLLQDVHISQWLPHPPLPCLIALVVHNDSEKQTNHHKVLNFHISCIY
jgi:hypothetical protein